MWKLSHGQHHSHVIQQQQGRDKIPMSVVLTVHASSDKGVFVKSSYLMPTSDSVLLVIQLWFYTVFRTLPTARVGDFGWMGLWLGPCALANALSSLLHSATVLRLCNNIVLGWLVEERSPLVTPSGSTFISEEIEESHNAWTAAKRFEKCSLPMEN